MSAQQSAEPETAALECPGGCGRVRHPRQLLCIRCWRLVSPELQNEVWRSWRWYRRAVDCHESAELLEDAREAYAAARLAAIAAVSERDPEFGRCPQPGDPQE